MASRLHVCVQQRYAPNPHCCANHGSVSLKNILQQKIQASEAAIEVVASGCMGMCLSGPNLRAEPQGKAWNRVTEEMLDGIVEYLVQADANT